MEQLQKSQIPHCPHFGLAWFPVVEQPKKDKEIKEKMQNTGTVFSGLPSVNWILNTPRDAKRLLAYLLPEGLSPTDVEYLFPRAHINDGGTEKFSIISFKSLDDETFSYRQAEGNEAGVPSEKVVLVYETISEESY